MFKNPVVFASILLGMIGLQIAASYFSVTAFLSDDLFTGISFFLFVPMLGFILAFYILWFRREKSGRP